jgi:murein DD-endopeptidase MepM/ murein hydrolase activator NlpD
MHGGVDLLPTGSTEGLQPVFAFADGTVEYEFFNGTPNQPGYGNTIVINHGNGCYTLYAHLAGNHVSLGDQVSKGDEIGYLAHLAIGRQSTGNAENTGAPVSRKQLHFELFTAPALTPSKTKPSPVLATMYPGWKLRRLDPKPFLDALGYKTVDYEAHPTPLPADCVQEPDQPQSPPSVVPSAAVIGTIR